MKTAKDIIEALRNPAVGMSSTEISEAFGILKQRRAHIDAMGARSFRVGDEVQFEARRTLHRGKVTKINQKTVEVLVPIDNPLTPWLKEQRWKVSPSVLVAVP